MNGKTKKTISSLLFQMFCILVGLLIISPILYAFFISFMPSNQILRRPPTFIPETWILDNYKMALTLTTLGRFMLNSLIIAGVSSIVRIVTASMAAFAFSFFHFKGKDLIFMLFMGTIMIPSDIVLVTNYQTTASLGLINTYLGMMLIFLVSATNVFMMRQYFLTFSVSLKEAAAVDGCGNLRFFLQILLPLSTPVITTIFISSFIGTWNTYVFGHGPLPAGHPHRRGPGPLHHGHRPLPYGDLPFSPSVVASCKVVEGSFADCLKALATDLDEEAKAAWNKTAYQEEAPKVSAPSPDGRPRVYLADVRRYDADGAQQYARLKEICRQHGLEGVSPLDGAADIRFDDPYTQAAAWFAQWQKNLRSCDLVLADLSDFHGLEPSADVAFECGCGWQLGKRCFGYMKDARIMQQRIPHYGPERGNADLCGNVVEDFNYPINLMFASSMPIRQASAEEAIAWAAQAFFARNGR